MATRKYILGQRCTFSDLERQILPVEAAGTLSDMGEVDLFLDKQSDLLAETVSAFWEIGASEIAECLASIQAASPARPDHLLNRANGLLCARAGYDYDAVLRFVASKIWSYLPSDLIL